jgi:serine/threonine-protein kinase HipA
MNGERVGLWQLDSNNVHRFAYDEAWLSSPRARPLSLSMPLRAAASIYRGEVVEAYFDNLLPENVDIRRRLMSRAQSDEVGHPIQLMPATCTDRCRPPFRRMSATR